MKITSPLLKPSKVALMQRPLIHACILTVFIVNSSAEALESGRSPSNNGTQNPATETLNAAAPRARGWVILDIIGYDDGQLGIVVFSWSDHRTLPNDRFRGPR